MVPAVLTDLISQSVRGTLRLHFSAGTQKATTATCGWPGGASRSVSPQGPLVRTSHPERPNNLPISGPGGFPRRAFAYVVQCLCSAETISCQFRARFGRFR